MHIVIEISESEIPKQQHVIEIPLHFIDGNVCEAGGYGFDVLPKGHGRLIDADALNFADIDNANYGSNYIRIAPTIIEADKTESEEV